MARDASGWMSPGRDARDGDLSPRERKALGNENSGSEARRSAVVSNRAAAGVVKGGTVDVDDD